MEGATEKEIKQTATLTMEILRDREDYKKLSKEQYQVAFRQSRDEAYKKVFGLHFFSRTNYYNEFRRKLFSKIGKELNQRPRKGGRQTHPKPKKEVNPLTLENIGNERTREALRRDLQEESDRKQAVKMLQTEFSGIIPSQYP